MDHVFSEAEEPELAGPPEIRAHAGRRRALERAVALLRDAERPVIMAGNGLYWAHGEHALRELAEAAGIPVFLNGLARGCLPADHELFFARARERGLKGADVALVIGVPMDFRLGFGGAFGDETELIVLDGAEPERDHPRPVAAELYGDVAAALRRAARRRRRRRRPARRGSSTCAASRRRSARPRRSTSPTTARRCTRCGSTASWPACSTATRS